MNKNSVNVHINLQDVIMLVGPTIIYFGYKKIKKSTTKLNKDFKINDVRTIDLPKEVVMKYDSLDEEKIKSLAYSEQIMNFINVVKKEIPDINLSIFYNNFNELGIKDVNFKLRNFLFKDDTGAQYTADENIIKMCKYHSPDLIYHELFHALSTIYDKENNRVYCGFNQYDENRKVLATGLNEGYTQHLTIKYFGDNKNYSGSYKFERIVAGILENILGQEVMQHFYFNANLNGLVEYMSKYLPVDEIYRFLNTLDFISENIKVRNLNEEGKKYIQDAFEYIDYFLYKLSLSKEVVDNNTKKISDDSLKMCIFRVAATMPKSFKTSDASYILDDGEIIGKVAEEIFLGKTNESEKGHTK